jgi:hypothetical protein
MTHKPNKRAEAFWQELVSTYFQFCREKFHDVPTFTGSAPRDLKNIITTLRRRAEKKFDEWDMEHATIRLRLFLEYAYEDEWLRENWLLSNIYRQMDKIIFNAHKQQSKK